jgi:anti-sigma factor RsiW
MDGKKTDSGVSKERGASRLWGYFAGALVVAVLVVAPIVLKREDPGHALRKAPIDDLTVSLIGVHRAATQAGVLQVTSTDAGVLQGWLEERGLGYATPPDLSSMGLALKGARLMAMPASDWAMLQYTDSRGQMADLLVVAAPPGEAVVPPEAEAVEVAGAELHLDRARGVGIAYLSLPGADWMLVSTAEAEWLQQLAGVLIAGMS